MIFSSVIPYAIVDIGMLLCGKYDPVIYETYYPGMELLPERLFPGFVVVALLILSLLLLAFICSKKRGDWLMVPLVFMIVDIIFDITYYTFNFQIIIDILFHGFIIIMIGRGLLAHYKLKKLPPEETDTNTPEEFVQEADESLLNSNPLRPADISVKSRTLLEYSSNGHNILYRRVKRTNELVIDGYVYDEYTALSELSHALTANLDGHRYMVGFDSRASTSFVKIDGITMIEKRRFI
jgi:hypothetical protein